MKVRAAIRTHRDQKGDENCWLDDQFYLYGLLPEKIGCDPRLPEKRLMMVNCSRYYDCRSQNKLYKPLASLDEHVDLTLMLTQEEQDKLIEVLLNAQWPPAPRPKDWTLNKIITSLLTKLGWRPSGGLP